MLIYFYRKWTYMNGDVDNVKMYLYVLKITVFNKWFKNIYKPT